MTIRILPPEVAARIAAGEVVERPASVVKELVENALDAGAAHIGVEIIEGGKRLIRVSDNGTGIPAEEVELAFQRHATSKLRQVEDLDHIETLGFRGEALASIAAISHLTLITRASSEQAGARVSLAGGEITDLEAVGAPQGTMVTVENLFYNVPARLKFLKKEVTERRLVSALISRYAMAYPDVRFSLLHGGKELLRTPGNGSLRDVLVAIYDTETAEQMLEIFPQEGEPLRDDLSPIEVSGFAGQPSLNRANRNQITLFVNGRWIQDSSLTYAVGQAYHTMLMTGRYPVAVIMITMPPEELDVNVHPAKSEVRFRDPSAVFSAVQRAVRQTLVGQAPPPAMREGVFWGSPEWAARRERLSQVTRSRINQMGLDIPLETTGQYMAQQPQDAPDAPSPAPPIRRKRNLPMLRIIGQVGATYLVAEGPEGLYLIDQHAAHERILYEQFMAERAGELVNSQELLEPAVVELLPEQAALVEENLNDLTAVGFTLEAFGRNTIQLRAVPALVAQGDPVEALLAALGDIECGEMPTESTAEEKLIARVCKQAAVKAGQVLSRTEMESLVRQLEQCESPQTCPHGRPTLIHISADQLAREFGRLGAK